MAGSILTITQEPSLPSVEFVCGNDVGSLEAAASMSTTSSITYELKSFSFSQNI